jgi:hypothetical protein
VWGPGEHAALARAAVEHVAPLARGDRDGVVRLGVAGFDHRVLGTRDVDHLLLAGDEELVADLERLAALVVGRDDLHVDARVLVELDGANLPRAAARDEAFGGPRKHHRGAAAEALVAVFIEEDAVLEALERDGLAQLSIIGDDPPRGKRLARSAHAVGRAGGRASHRVPGPGRGVVVVELGLCAHEAHALSRRP